MEHIRRMRPGAPIVVEWHSRHRDGGLFWSEVGVRRARVYGEDRLVVVVRDIPNANAPPRNTQASKSNSGRCRRWRAWVSWRPASRTTSTIS